MNAADLAVQQRPTLGQNAAWQPLAQFDSGRQAAISRAIEQMIATHPNACLDHDPAWLAARAQGAERFVRTYVCLGENDELLGYAPFFVYPSAFSFSSAGFTLYNHPIQRYAITAQPLLAGDDTRAAELATALLSRLHHDLTGRAVAFGLGVPLQSAFARALSSSSIRALFHIMPYGAEYQRRLLAMPASLDDYFARLGAKTRQDLRRHERRLAKETGDDVNVLRYTSSQSIADFLQAVEVISRKTYQWNLLHMGVSSDEATRRLLESAAQHGWFRGYVLNCRGVPAAFMIGFLYRGVYYSETIGYDPVWADWSIGNMLHLHVLRDLIPLGGDQVRWFDFMYGDNSNKERLSTDAHAERQFYIIPRRARWTLLLAALRGFDAAAGSMISLLQRWGLKARLQRMLRRRATVSAKDVENGR